MKQRTIALMTAALLMSALPGCSREASYDKPPTPVRAQKVQNYDGEAGVRYSATFKPSVQVDLSFRLAGYVRELLQLPGPDGRERPVQEGDRVDRGTVLARLRDGDYTAKLNLTKAQQAEAQAAGNQAAAQLGEANAELALAGKEFHRAAQLFSLRSLTQPEYDAAKARHDGAKARARAAGAQLAAAKARAQAAGAGIQEAELALQDTVLRAPMAGVILKRTVEAGSLVAPGTLAFVLADTSIMKLTIGVPDVVLEKLQMGLPLTARTEAYPGVELHGSVTRISPAADPNSRVFEVEMSIPNKDDRLKSGMVASVELSTPKLTQPIPVVPLSAVLPQKDPAGGYAVFLLVEQGGKQVARLRSVKLGEIHENHISVLEGVAEGDSVIVTGSQFITDGQTVRAMP